MTSALTHERLGTGLRIVLLHDVLYSRAGVRSLAEELALDHEVIVADLPGHGPHPTPVISPTETACSLATAFGPAVWIGHGLGGRLALQIAAQHPPVVDAVAAIAPWQEPASCANEIPDGITPSDLLASELVVDGADALCRAFGRARLHRDTAEEQARAAIAAHVPHQLAAALTMYGSDHPSWQHDWSGVTAPLRIIAGSRDPDACKGLERAAAATGRRAPGMLVDGAGTAPHLDAPLDVATLIRAWLATL